MFDIIIIGGGVAGMTAALYALRNNKRVLILEKENIGGQIAKSPKVENYPTVKEISGAELSEKLFEQILDLGVAFELENVVEVNKNEKIFTITTNYNTYQSKTVIIATGATPRKLNLENEERFIGKGVYYCAICDGPFFAGEEVSLIGDANSALQYALMLSAYCKKVHMFTLFDKFFGEKALQDAVFKTPNIEVTHNCQAVDLKGESVLECVIFKKGDIEFEHKTKAVFVAIGQVPENEIFTKLVDVDKHGFIISDEKCTTFTEGLFVAGDCRTKDIRQVTTAISDGAVSATAACKFLSSLGE